MTKDEFSYLEETNGERMLAWTKAENDRALRELEGDPRFQRYYELALKSEQARHAADPAGLIPYPRRLWVQGDWVYQVWTDTADSRGLWRRAPLPSYLERKPEWQVLLDLDALSARESANWTLVSTLTSPNARRVLLELKIEGLLTSTWREFDLDSRKFVADGFHVPSSRSMMVWRDDNTVMISTDLESSALSKAGNPISVKAWSRGESLKEAKEIFRGRQEDYAVYVGSVAVQGENTRQVLITQVDGAFNFHRSRLTREDRLERFAAAHHSSVTPIPYKDQYLMILKQDWQTGGKTWKKGSVLAIPASDITKDEPRVSIVLVPERDTSVLYVAARTERGLLLHGSHLNNSRMWRAEIENGTWTTEPVPLPAHGKLMPEDSDLRSNTVFVHYEGFLQPRSLYKVDVAANEAVLFASGAAQFDGSRFVTEQLEAKSADGVLVPYMMVRSRTLPFDGNAPALVIGYGASGVTNLPNYSGTLGKLWLEQGGVYVVANIRGGQERGREWAVQGIERQHTYDDMIAVTEDLIRRRVTAAKRVAFMGHSNGGLLGGVMLTQRPDLFGAVVLKAPVLDQFRLDLTAYGSVPWLKEYGSPDVPSERAFLERTSPFQNLRRGAKLPRPFIITSTTDQTAGPAQARRFAAKMASLNMPFLFYETAEGGHGLAVTMADAARLDALIYTYLSRQLMDQR